MIQPEEQVLFWNDHHKASFILTDQRLLVRARNHLESATARSQVLQFPISKLSKIAWGHILEENFSILRINCAGVAYAFGFLSGKNHEGHHLGRAPDERLAEFVDLASDIQRAHMAQLLTTIAGALRKIPPGINVPIATIQERLLNDAVDVAQTEQLLLRLQEDNNLPGEYEPITQTFRRAELEVAPPEQEFTHSAADLACRFCGELIAEGANVCPDCGREVSICPICRRPLSFGELIGRCLYCETAFHESHLLEAVKVQGKCPLCQEALAESEIVREEVNKKSKMP